MPAPKRSARPDSVLCLGTGDGWPCGDRNPSSYLHELGGARVLIDCGDGVARALTARKFDWDSLDAILLSHTHADHLGGFQMLIQSMWLEGRRRPVEVHLPAHAIEPLRALLRHGYLFDELFRFKLKFKALRPRVPLKVNGLTITPFLTSHLAGLRSRFGRKPGVGFEAFGFVLETARCRVVHSADLGEPKDLLTALVEPVDLLVCELAHFSAGELFETLAGRSVRNVALIHVGRAQRRRLGAIEREAGRRLPESKSWFPKDGDRLRIR
jgi:ribonuclease Z